MGRYKYFSYASVKDVTDFGLVRARLMGTYKKVSQSETVLSSPYRLVVGVIKPLEHMGVGQTCVLRMDEITMTALDTHTVVYSSRNTSDPFVLGMNKDYIAGIDRELPEIPYVDYELALTMSITGCRNDDATRHFRLVISRDYTEGEKTYWDFFRNL